MSSAPPSTLGQAFDPKRNVLNALRLVFAAGVILQHSWPLTGRSFDTPFDQLFQQLWVDGFFVISGFLITASWLHNPRMRDYVAARFLRIFPGLWVCLVVVAFAMAPIGVALQHGPALQLRSQLLYVLNNGVLNIFYTGIDGTPKGVPWPGVWDGPLWTLIFELICYLAVAVLGVVGLLNRTWTLPVIFVVAVVGAAVVSYPVGAVETIPQMATRFAVVFTAGALLHQYRDRIPARWWLVGVCAGLVVVAGLLPNYRVWAALPLAYAVIVAGTLLRTSRLRLRNDLSYGMYIYAWPVQQLLAMAGLTWLPPLAFFALATVLTVPLAAASWFLVEKHAMSVKSRLQHTTSVTSMSP